MVRKPFDVKSLEGDSSTSVIHGAVHVGSSTWDVCSVPRHEISVSLIPMSISREGGIMVSTELVRLF